MEDERRHMQRKVIWMALAAFLLFLVAVGVMYSRQVFAALSAIWIAALPLVFGCIIAFVVNLLMSRFERVYFPKSQNRIAQATRRPVCLVLSFVTIALIVTFIVYLCLPQIRSSLDVVKNGVVMLSQNAYVWVEENMEMFSTDLGATWLNSIAESFNNFINSPSNGESASELWSALGSVFSTVYSIAHGIFIIVVGLVFSLYLLLDKERVLRGANAAVELLLPKRYAQAVCHAAHVANESFSRFISGQCIEALILGTLCALGMTLFGMPYAAAVGACVGLTALVPLFGAWLGGIIGFLMLLTVNPMTAVWFVVFLVVLQQIETHLIYPNVVGASVGLPSIWVFSSVLVGGALLGVAGMFLGVPSVATVRTLVMEYAAKVRAEKAQDDTQDFADVTSEESSGAEQQSTHAESSDMCSVCKVSDEGAFEDEQ